LSGSLCERSRAAFAAGCDVVLHCNGRLDEMMAVAAEAPELSGDVARRATIALAGRRHTDTIDLARARAEFASLMAAPLGRALS
jgi:beta-N-acetylhexosaminidase